MSATIYLELATGVDPFVPNLIQTADGRIIEDGVSYHPELTTEQTLAPCPADGCGRYHPALWRIRRARVDLGLAYYGFRINGTVRAPDPSIPYTIEKLPRDAVRLTPADAAPLWHSTIDSHVFGATVDVGALLRATIAEHNARDDRAARASMEGNQ